MVVRELLTRLGFAVNDSKLKQYERGTNNIKSSAESAAASFRNMFAAFAGFQAIKSLSQVADKMQSMEARIGMLPQTVGDAGAAFDTVSGRASAARQSLDAYGNLYIKLSNAGKDYIKTQEDGLKITDTLSKALVVGGATAQEQSSAMLQFAQAIGSGVLQGDELRAMAEASPQFMDELANAIGKPRAELKKMGSEGKLTSKMVIQAVQKMAVVFDKKFLEMPMTIGQATTIMGNRWATFVNRLNRESGAVTKIADLFLKGFDRIESGLGSMVKFFGGATNTLKFFAIAITALVLPALVRLGAGLMATVFTPAGAVVAALLLLGLVLEDVYTWINGGDSLLGEWFGSWEENKEAVKAWGDVALIALGAVGVKMAWLAGQAVVSAAATVAAWVPAILTLASVFIAKAVLMTAAFASVAVSVIAATWPIMLIIAAIIALGAAIYWLWKNWDKVFNFIKEIAANAWNFISSGFESMVNSLQDKWNKFKSFFGAGVETTISANGAAGGSVTSIAPNRAAGVTATPYANAGNVTQQNTFQFQMPAGSTQSQVDALRGAVGQQGVLDGVTRQMSIMGAQ